MALEIVFPLPEWYDLPGKNGSSRLFFQPEAMRQEDPSRPERGSPGFDAGRGIRDHREGMSDLKEILKKNPKT
jgi:hypothetical protein